MIRLELVLCYAVGVLSGVAVMIFGEIRRSLKK